MFHFINSSISPKIVRFAAQLHCMWQVRVISESANYINVEIQAAALHFAFFVSILWGKIKNLCNEKRSMNSKVPRNICKVTGESRRRRGVTTYNISQVATYVKVSKSQKIFLFSFHLQKRKININLLQVIL